MTQSITLPASGSNGTTITWSSDNAAVIAINGVVSRPTYNDGEAATVTVTLTATISKNGDSETKTFTLTVKKISTSATLSNLTVSKGILQPAFDSSITTYLDAPVPFSDSATPAYNDTQSASITATATNSAATITINSNTVASGSAYVMNNLAVGANTATIIVTAEDGVTTAAYTVTVYRAIPVFKTGAGAISGYTLDPREDGATQLGVSWPSQRFTDNDDGTMTDNMTGLVWQTTASTYSGYWSDWLSGCESSTANGYNDWRMPNMHELLSMTNYGYNVLSSWLTAQGFSSMSYSWSSTTTAYDHNRAWNITSDGGQNCNYNKGSQPVTVWQVRSESLFLPRTGQTTVYTTGDDGTYQKGVSFPSIRFRDNGDGTITDNMTGLMWLKDANNANSTKDWSNAFTYIAGLNSGTSSGNCNYTDWRLPTVNELETLTYYGMSAPLTWLNSYGFTNVINGLYWTGTTCAGNTDYAWIVGLNLGGIKYIGKGNDSYYVWPVRGPIK